MYCQNRTKCLEFKIKTVLKIIEIAISFPSRIRVYYRTFFSLLVICTIEYNAIHYSTLLYYTHTYMHVYMYVCMCVCMHVCMHVYMYVCMYVCVYVCMYVCMYICMYVCMYVCV